MLMNYKQNTKKTVSASRRINIRSAFLLGVKSYINDGIVGGMIKKVSVQDKIC